MLGGQASTRTERSRQFRRRRLSPVRVQIGHTVMKITFIQHYFTSKHQFEAVLLLPRAAACRPVVTRVTFGCSQSPISAIPLCSNYLKPHFCPFSFESNAQPSASFCHQKKSVRGNKCLRGKPGAANVVLKWVTEQLTFSCQVKSIN